MEQTHPFTDVLAANVRDDFAAYLNLKLEMTRLLDGNLYLAKLVNALDGNPQAGCGLTQCWAVPYRMSKNGVTEAPEGAILDGETVIQMMEAGMTLRYHWENNRKIFRLSTDEIGVPSTVVATDVVEHLERAKLITEHTRTPGRTYGLVSPKRE